MNENSIMLFSENLVIQTDSLPPECWRVRRRWNYLSVTSVLSPMVIAAIIHEKEMLGYNGIEILFKVVFM